MMQVFSQDKERSCKTARNSACLRNVAVGLEKPIYEAHSP